MIERILKITIITFLVKCQAIWLYRFCIPSRLHNLYWRT